MAANDFRDYFLAWFWGSFQSLIFYLRPIAGRKYIIRAILKGAKCINYPRYWFHSFCFRLFPNAL